MSSYIDNVMGTYGRVLCVMNEQEETQGQYGYGQHGQNRRLWELSVRYPTSVSCHFNVEVIIP